MTFTNGIMVFGVIFIFILFVSALVLLLNEYWGQGLMILLIAGILIAIGLSHEENTKARNENNASQNKITIIKEIEKTSENSNINNEKQDNYKSLIKKEIIYKVTYISADGEKQTKIYNSYEEVLSDLQKVRENTTIIIEQLNKE